MPSESFPLRPRSRPTGATKWPHLWTPATVPLVRSEKVGKDGWGEEGEPTQKSPMTFQKEVGLVNPEEPAHSRYTPGSQLPPVWVLQNILSVSD